MYILYVSSCGWVAGICGPLVFALCICDLGLQGTWVSAGRWMWASCICSLYLWSGPPGDLGFSWPLHAGLLYLLFACVIWASRVPGFSCTVYICQVSIVNRFVMMCPSFCICHLDVLILGCSLWGVLHLMKSNKPILKGGGIVCVFPNESMYLFMLPQMFFLSEGGPEEIKNIS